MQKTWTGNRARLERARAEIKALAPRMGRQRQLKALLLDLIPVIEESAEAGREADFEWAWGLLEGYRAAWEAPEVWAAGPARFRPMAAARASVRGTTRGRRRPRRRRGSRRRRHR